MTAVTARLAACLLAVVLVASGCNGARRDQAGQITTAGSLSVYDLRTGDCFNDGVGQAGEEGNERRVREVSAVPCDEPHDNEVFATLRHPAGEDEPFPGEAAVTGHASEECLARFERYVGERYEDSGLAVAAISPREESWEEGDRTIVCVLLAGDGRRLTGSRRG